jgi:hypothetical protein
VRRTVIRSRSRLSLSENVSPAELLAREGLQQLGITLVEHVGERLRLLD